MTLPFASQTGVLQRFLSRKVLLRSGLKYRDRALVQQIRLIMIALSNREMSSPVLINGAMNWDPPTGKGKVSAYCYLALHALQLGLASIRKFGSKDGIVIMECCWLLVGRGGSAGPCQRP